MKNIFLLLLVLFQTAAYSEGKKVTLFQVTDEKPILTLEWIKKEIAGDKNNSVLLTGEFKDPYQDLYLNGKKIKLNKDRVFQLLVYLNPKSVYSSFTIEAKGANPEVQTQTIVVGIDELQARPPKKQNKKEYLPVIDISDFNEEVPVHRDVKWNQMVSGGFSFHKINQPGLPEVSQSYFLLESNTLVNVFDEYGFIGGDIHLDALALKSGEGGRSLRMFSVFPFFAVRLKETFGVGTYFQPRFGILYSTSFSSGDDFGYSNFFSPTLGFEIGIKLNDAADAGLGFDYSMTKSAQSDWGLSNGEWKIESWVKLKNLLFSQPTSFFLRYGALKLNLPNGADLYKHSGFILGLRLSLADKI